jgi:hypothetical protein
MPRVSEQVETTPKKKGRTNTPWTAEEEQRLKAMRDTGKSWSEIAKVNRTHVKKKGKQHTNHPVLSF